MLFHEPAVLDDVDQTNSSSKTEEPAPPSQPPPRKLCIRHQRMADEGTNLKLQQVSSLLRDCIPNLGLTKDFQSLDALPFEEREAVNAVWSNFSSSSHPRRALILQGLLTMCCFSQLSLLTEQLAHLIRIDPFSVFPREVSLKVLGYLDATSLCRAAQVTKQWKSLADDDILWRGICEQHIGQKCHKCGWGLPVLEKKRTYRPTSGSSSPSPAIPSGRKRALPDDQNLLARPSKRQRSEPLNSLVHADASDSDASSSSCDFSPSDSLLAPHPSLPVPDSITRPWKDVYSERLTIERNWRRGRCTVRTLKGHSDGVMCLQFSETLTHPQFPVLITGSYDRTVRVWNLETGVELHCLKGHTRAVRALQFDEVKLITGSMDHTIRVWDWRRGKCIRVLTGHTEGVVCLNFDSNVLASGSVDSTIKVWNLRTGGAFTLRGHRDWVNSVQLWDSNPGARTSSSSTPMFDVTGSSSPSSSSCNAAPQIDPGKMLFSASDDGTIKLWDLTLRTCVRQFTGHVGQVQSMKLLLVDECGDDAVSQSVDGANQRPVLPSSTSASALFSSTDSHTLPTLSNSPPPSHADIESLLGLNDVSTATTQVSKTPKPMLISGSLDNTIKLWDIETGNTLRTLFGHIEGVWAVVSDKLRLVSGSHDRTIKVCSISFFSVDVLMLTS